MPPPGKPKTNPDFFKRFAVPKHRPSIEDAVEDEMRLRIPKSRIPVNDVVEDEIVVASHSRSGSSSLSKRDGPLSSSLGSTSSEDAASPTTTSPVGTPQKRSHLSKVDDAMDTTPIVSSPSSAQKMVLNAVEVPSPRLPPPPPPTKDAIERPPAASFSSISTLSSVPMSSSSSSRRIVKDGINAVTNSDSGSADSDSEELADPSTFIVSKRRKLTPPGKDADHAIEIIDSAQTIRQSDRISKEKRSSMGGRPSLPPSPPRPVYKHSLSSLVKQRQKEEKAVIRMKEAEVAFDEAQKKREERMKQEQDLSSGLRAATADDSDEGDRMLLAMQRTEALQEDAKFCYFHKRLQRPAIRFLAIYDPADEASRPWMKLLRSEESRRQAFLSGFVADMAAKDSLPVQIYEWIEGEVLYEESTDLCEAYTEVLQACASRMPSFKLGDVFSGLHYFYQTIEDSEGDKKQNQASIPDGPPPGLRYVFRIVQQFCTVPAILANSVATLIVHLAAAGADEYVKGDAALLNELHDTIESVLDADPKEDCFEAICEHVHQAFFALDYLSEQLRCRIIAALPATSERTHHLRRLLTLHLVAGFTRGRDYHNDPNSPEWVEIVTGRLMSAPEFNISQTTNYSLFDSLIEILDIAFDAGFSNLPLQSSHPAPRKTTLHLSNQTTVPTAESTFNSQIDTITQQLRLMSSRIRGSGTSHLRRTEAKSSLERLIMRLEHSVRTRPKPRKGIFGGATSEQRAFLSGFLKPDSAKPGNESDSVSVVPPEMLSDREVGDDKEISGNTSTVSGAEST